MGDGQEELHALFLDPIIAPTVFKKATMDSSSKLPVERPSNPVHSITIGSPDGLFSPAGLSENVSKGDVRENLVKKGELV